MVNNYSPKLIDVGSNPTTYITEDESGADISEPFLCLNE